MSFTTTETPAAPPSVHSVPKVVRLPGLSPPDVPSSNRIDPDREELDLEARVRQLESELEALRRANRPGVQPAGFTLESLAQPPECGCGDPFLTDHSGHHAQHNSDVHSEACAECLPADWQQRLAAFLSRPEYPTVQSTGFLQLDIGWITQDDANKASVGEIEGSTGLRRVRLAVYGDVRETISYLVDLDFAAEGHPSFRDVLLDIHNFGRQRSLQFGYYQQPFGLDAMTSGRELLLLERQLPFAFAPFRQTGLGPYGTWAEERATWAMSAFRFPTDAFGVNIGNSGGWAIATRATYLPLDHDDSERLIHTGIGYSYGDPGNNIVRYAIEPGFFVTDPTSSGAGSSVPAFVDTGDIPTHNFNLLNMELGANLGSLTFQSEVRGALVDQAGGPYLGFWGAYATVAYVLTGESHPYDRARGTFRRVVPTQDYERSCGGGAWEVAASWGFINLNDKNIAGGKMQSIVLGLNRYLNPYTKFQLNVIRSLLDDPVIGQSEATVVAIRTQVEF